MINHIMTATDAAGPLAENPYSPAPTPQPEHTIVSGALVGSIF